MVDAVKGNALLSAPSVDVTGFVSPECAEDLPDTGFVSLTCTRAVPRTGSCFAEGCVALNTVGRALYSNWHCPQPGPTRRDRSRRACS